MAVPQAPLTLHRCAILSFGAGRADPSHDAPHGESLRSSDYEQPLERAQVALALRKRRIEVLGQRYSSEPPFAMLVALYVTEAREPALMITRLGTFAGLGISSTLRWLNALLEDDLVERSESPDDRRIVYIKLSAKGRDALEQIFSWND